MRAFNLRSILFSLTAIFAIAVFFTACTQKEEIAEITTSVTADETTLAQKLAEDPNFKTLQELNEALIANIGPKTDLASIQVISEDQLSTLTEQLLNNIPELKNMEATALEDVISEANGTNAIELRNPCAPPVNACLCCRQIQTNSLRACSDAAYAVYLSGGTYEAYLNAYYNICVPNYYAAVALCPC